MSRAARGLPLLYNHDTGQPIGRLEDVALRSDGKLGAEMRFSRSARAQEIRQDVVDGILTDTSIGYRIDAWTEARDGQDVTYTATRWTPMEGSIVPVPADDSVGINRGLAIPGSAATFQTPAPEKETKMADQTPTPDTGTVKALVDAQVEQRKQEIKLLGDVAKTFKMEHRLSEWIDKDFSLEKARADIEADAVRNASTATPAGHLDLTPKEHQQYNLGRAIMAIATGKWEREGGLEKEASDEIAKRSGKPSRGLYLPMTLQTRASITGNIVGTSSLGGAAVQTTLMSLIEILRNRLIVRQCGARFLSGLTDTISFPRQITANTFNWTGENPTSANSLGALTLNNVTLSPKTGMVSTAFSRQALIQTSPDMQSLVLDDIANVVAVGIDSAAINGTGSNSQPTGVRNTSGIGNRTLGANGAVITWANLVGLETDVAVQNADLGSLAYLTNATQRGVLKTTLKNTVAGSLYMWEGNNQPGSVNGYNAYVSNQVPSNLTQGTATTICSSIIFGNWAELLVGEWGGAVDLIVDPYTGASQNMIYVTGITMVDVGVRHAGSFSKTDAAL
jgi:HK97 family phage major capsid protein/HK97 family phage prohead protease